MIIGRLVQAGKKRRQMETEIKICVLIRSRHGDERERKVATFCSATPLFTSSERTNHHIHLVGGENVSLFTFQLRPFDLYVMEVVSDPTIWYNIDI